MPSWQFDDDTALEAVSDRTWRTRLSSAWNIGDNPNGGYAAAGLLAAMAALAGRPDPLSITTHYLRPASAGAEAEVSADLVRSGRRATTVTGSVSQSGTERLRSIGTFGDVGDPEDADLSLEPPQLPAPGACPSRATVAQGLAELAILSRLDVRIDPDLAEPGSGGRAEMAGWIRFADGRPPDSMSLPLFADSFPPSLFTRLGPVGWVPTIELTVHVRRRPAPGWVQARFRTRDLAGPYLIEDGELWDETGALVARCRQLALLLT